MKIESGGCEFSLCFMTPAWAPDLGHFRWLRRSLERSGLADAPHYVVVQTEDRDLFEPLAGRGMKLLASADVLPPAVERERVAARRRIDRYGRRFTKFCASLQKRTGLCDWMRYSGWHVQQITKLAAAGDLPYDVVVVLDSDIQFIRPFDLRLFVPDGKVAVPEHLSVTRTTPGLSWKWHCNARTLLKQPINIDEAVNGHVGTPYMLERRTVLALRQWLEQEYRQPWYVTLLEQPLAGWSEFQTYNVFAHAYGDPSRIRFAELHRHIRGLDSHDDRLNGEAIIRAAYRDPQGLFLYLPSDRRGRQRWPMQGYQALLEEIYADEGAANASRTDLASAACEKRSAA